MFRFNQNQICPQLSQSLKPTLTKCYPSNLLDQYEVVIIGYILSCRPDDNDVKSEFTNKFVKICSNQWADAEYWISWDASCPDWVELIVRAEKSDFHVDWIFKHRLLVPSQLFQGKNKRILIEQSNDLNVIVIFPSCFAALSYLSNHDVWSGLLDLVLRKAHKCTVNVKRSLNLSGMNAALPSCWPLLRCNIASCENHLGPLAFKDLCPRPNWTENNVFVVKIILNLVRMTILFLEAVEAKHRCKIEKRTTDKIQITCDILMSSTQPNQGTISHQILNHKKGERRRRRLTRQSYDAVPD